ncbi:MAG TPA: PQQ-binding-like beta-propeller repeat protein [bacterium]
MAIALASEPDGVNWPSFRGPNASGIAPEFSTPVTWNVETSENIKWKVAISGLGHSCPVIWGDRVFVTTASSGKSDDLLRVGLYGDIAPVEDESKHKWVVYCLDKKSGKVLWERVAHEGVPKIKRHTKATHANSTPATDGKHLVACFGSEGLYCYDFSGKLIWEKDLGLLESSYFRAPDAQWGFGSSPIIHENLVIVQCDVLQNSFLAAFDINDGHEVWRTSRDDVPSWSTPAVHKAGERAQIIVNGYRHMGGYELASGKELWKLSSTGDIPVPTPVIGDGLVYLTNAHGGGAPIYAVRLDATGDISLTDGVTANDHIVWSDPRNGNYMQTPLLYGEYLYTCKDGGVLTCYDAKTGQRFYRERLGTGKSGFTASPVAADGKLYHTSEDGDIFVIQIGAEYKELAVNSMGEICMATPAISEGTLFFRTRGHMVAVGEK